MAQYQVVAQDIITNKIHKSRVYDNTELTLANIILSSWSTDQTLKCWLEETA